MSELLQGENGNIVIVMSQRMWNCMCVMIAEDALYAQDSEIGDIG